MKGGFASTSPLGASEPCCLQLTTTDSSGNIHSFVSPFQSVFLNLCIFANAPVLFNLFHLSVLFSLICIHISMVLCRLLLYQHQFIFVISQIHVFIYSLSDTPSALCCSQTPTFVFYRYSRFCTSFVLQSTKEQSLQSCPAALPLPSSRPHYKSTHINQLLRLLNPHALQQSCFQPV
ncbi:hypothetical protein BJ165DRAFT_713135 [Panaeolus papilionaceus]|nr:hypothetical protein BJ165DRAFT_713135 [Panaeolus papilionaceus]